MKTEKTGRNGHKREEKCGYNACQWQELAGYATFELEDRKNNELIEGVRLVNTLY